jgi:hypothetical protein
MLVRRRSALVRIGLGIATSAMLGMAGCAGMQNPFGGGSPQEMAAADRPPPMVQNCGIVTIGSPTKYACNGKTYTSFDLLKLRQSWEKSHGG